MAFNPYLTNKQTTNEINDIPVVGRRRRIFLMRIVLKPRVRRLPKQNHVNSGEAELKVIATNLTEQQTACGNLNFTKQLKAVFDNIKVSTVMYS